jgi:hypothetical protein
MRARRLRHQQLTTPLRILSCLALCLLFLSPVFGQRLLSFSSRWSDQLNEWEFETDEAEHAGEIRMQWTMQNDWTDWSISMGNQSGRLRLKWKDNPNEWELRMGGEIVTIRTAWRGRYQEWIVTSDSGRFTIRTVYGNILEAWETLNKTDNYFGLYTTWEGDSRNWTVVDEMKEEVSMPTKLALAFIAILHSIPR